MKNTNKSHNIHITCNKLAAANCTPEEEVEVYKAHQKQWLFNDSSTFEALQ